MMRGQGTSAKVTVLLTVICLALGLIIYGEVRGQAEPVSTSPSAKNPEFVAAGMPPVFTMPPPETFSAILERPVFVVSRRAIFVGKAQEASLAPSEIEIVGIVVSDGDRFAIVKAHNGAQPEPAREGQVIDGWSIQAIGTDHVRMRRGATEINVALDYTSPPPWVLRPQPPAQPSANEGPVANEEPVVEKAPSE